MQTLTNLHKNHAVSQEQSQKLAYCKNNVFWDRRKILKYLPKPDRLSILTQIIKMDL